MLNFQIITVWIDRPYAEVYAFCADPLNFNRWASAPDSTMDPLGNNQYLVDLPRGRMVIRFTPYNAHGVLDYQVYEPGETTGPTRPVRLIPLGTGAQLQLTWIQDEGVPDVQFVSEVEWIASDIQRLKVLLEGG
jgi:hypothetical protein